MSNQKEVFPADVYMGNNTSKDDLFVSYRELVQVFGNPNGEFDSYKSDCSWKLQTPAGVADIYNWKNGKNYLGKQGMEVEDIDEWHVEVDSPEVMGHLLKALKENQ